MNGAAAAAAAQRVEQDVSCGDATEDSAKYLDELVKDMRELNALPGAYPHALRLLNEEIDRVWCVLYPGGVSNTNPTPAAAPAAAAAPTVLSAGPATPPTTVPHPTIASLLAPPPPTSSSSTAASLFAAAHLGSTTAPSMRDTFTPTSPRTLSAHENILAIQRAYAALVGSHMDPFEGGVTVQEKIPIPYYPRCNFIGRILGPRGISVKQIESETDCHILVRGRGSVKDPVREARLLNQPGWEHLAEPLHVLIQATDVSQASAEVKLRRGVAAVTKLLTPSNDEHKRRQLVQLAIINGTYRCDAEP